MTSELVVCSRCKSEYAINYGGHRLDDDLVTSITPCKCYKNNVNKSYIKPLDLALLKLKDVLNEKSNRSSR